MGSWLWYENRGHNLESEIKAVRRKNEREGQALECSIIQDPLRAEGGGGGGVILILEFKARMER